MLKDGGRGPRPTREDPSSRTPSGGSTSRLPLALIGVGGLAVAAVLFVALRGAEPERGATAPRPSARATQRPSTDAPAETPRAPRTPPGASARTPPPRTAEVAEPPAPELEARDVSDPGLKAVLEARSDRSPRGTRTLIGGLTSKDEIVVAESAKALIARHATEAIAPLAAIDLEEAAGSGLSVIDALGKLGGAAEGDERDAAVDRLLQMLRDEKRRGARESPGNLLQIYEALGDTQDPRAAPALEAELLDASVPRAPKVVIVQALVEIGLPSSKTALTTAHAEQSTEKGSDAFEEEIRQELVTALEAALAAF